MKKKFTNLFNKTSQLEVKQEYDQFKKNVINASDVSPDSSVRGKRFLEPIDRWFRNLDALTDRFIPSRYNPFTQAGAVANVSFMIALVTGFILLIWYRPSVFLAYETVQAMGDNRYVGGMTRSLHRYSSDVCMLFILFHAFKVFFAGRFTGSRVLAWITGIIAAWLIWFDGWLGYWLVWDERGGLTAKASARVMDVLPVFVEPLSSSFLTNESFSSLLFFIVFFLHMLIPLAFGVALWLHVSRLNKPKFFTDWNFAIIITITMIALSIIYPADLAEPADMLQTPAELTGDWFYLIPLFVTERLQGGMLWLVSLGGFFLLCSVPWIFKRRKKQTIPEVKEAVCNGCTQCVQDCPYNAVAMYPRQDGNLRKSEQVAIIDPSVCVSCGICVGSCDPVAIDYPGLSPWEIRSQIDGYLDSGKLEGKHVAFTCGNCAGKQLKIDPETGESEELPGYLIIAVPCAGWVHPSLIERAMKKGAGGVVVLGCQSDPDFRLGSDWLRDRVEGTRHPEMRTDRVQEKDLLFMKLDPSEMPEFISAAKDFRQRNTSSEGNESSKSSQTAVWKKAVAGIFLAVLISGITAWFSAAPIPLPEPETQLTVQFKMKGSPITMQDRDDAHLGDHMRSPDRQQVQRRADIRLKIVADGEIIHDDYYRPSGIRRRGYSNAIVGVPLSPGGHSIDVFLGDSSLEEDNWLHQQSREIHLDQGRKAVLMFDENYGFRWYLPDD